MSSSSATTLQNDFRDSRWLERIDRRVIYILVAIALAIPLIFDWSLPPAPMKSADSFYAAVSDLKPQPGKIVLIAADWGPGTKAENEPQTGVAIEHLMRKRIPFALITTYALATPFLDSVPEEIAKKLSAENPAEKWEYGKDWVNLGYRFGGYQMIQGLAKTEDLSALLKTDARGTPLRLIPCFSTVKSIRDVLMLMEFTGLVGVFNDWVQFFQTEAYRPAFVHGCTSITIPEAYLFLSSKQIVGLHEGVAGAAWYEKLLDRDFPHRKGGAALRKNTSLAVAHLVIIAFIFLGNLGYMLKRFSRRSRD